MPQKTLLHRMLIYKKNYFVDTRNSNCEVRNIMYKTNLKWHCWGSHKVSADSYIVIRARPRSPSVRSSVTLLWSLTEGQGLPQKRSVTRSERDPVVTTETCKEFILLICCGEQDSKLSNRRTSSRKGIAGEYWANLVSFPL